MAQLTPEQAAQYQAWVNAGAVGNPPAFATGADGGPAANAPQAVTTAQNSPFASAFDLTGTNSNGQPAATTSTAQITPQATQGATATSGFTGLTNTSGQGATTGLPTTLQGVPQQQPPNPPATGTTGTPAVGTTGSGFSGLVGGGTTPPTTGGGTSVQALPPPTLQGGQTSGTTPPTGTTQPTLPSAGGPQQWNTQSYLQAHPDLLNNWTTDPHYKEVYGTLDNYALDDAKNNGDAASKAAALTYQAPPNTSYNPATQPTTTGPSNYNQAQNASQGGTFATQGQTNTAQAQTSGQTSQQQQVGQTQQQQVGTTNTVGTQDQTGGNTQQSQQTGTTQEHGTQQQTGTTTGTTTSAPVDVLGFGKLLQNQATGVEGSDATRQGFLQDVVNTGGSAFGSQVDQAVRNSLSGPQMTGAGDSARARAAGYAGAQIGRNNLDQRLSAAQQLAGPTGLATLSTAAQPYGVGQQQTSTGNTSTSGTTSNTGANTTNANSTGTNFSNLTNNQNVQNALSSLTNTANSASGAQSGFSNLLGSSHESQGGSAAGQSSQSAIGQVPSAQTVSTGGGCVLCTAATELGLFRNLRVLRRVIDWKLRNKEKQFRAAARGYFFIFTPLARTLLTKRRLARLLYPLARAVVYEELRISGVKIPFRLWPAFVHWTGHGACALVGKFPIPRYVNDPVIESIARKNNIWIPLS